jgi:hypothetical protein
MHRWREAGVGAENLIRLRLSPFFIDVADRVGQPLRCLGLRRRRIYDIGFDGFRSVLLECF